MMNTPRPRPSSSLSQRPPSSLSSARPPSSASLRPHSRISTRPSSRLARRSSRLLPLSQSLVTQVTGLTPETDDENFRIAVEFMSKNLEFVPKAGPSTDMTTMDKHFRGHILKASINSHDSLADALQESYRKVKEKATELTDLDERIKSSRLPDHLQLLLLLSSAPDNVTHAFSETYKDARQPEPQAPITWSEILDEEPFEGQHWEGVYGLPLGSTVEGWETRSGGSTPSLSPWDEEDYHYQDNDGTSPSFEHLPPPSIGTHRKSDGPRVHYQRDYVESIEQLKARQYWRDDWKIDVNMSRPFNLGDPSTLGPAMTRVLGERQTLTFVGPEREKYIHERDAVREVLMCLQGRKCLVIYTTPDTFSSVPSPTSPRLLHFTLTAQSSIMSAFAKVTTTICHLRKFVSAILDGVSAIHDITPSGTMRLLTHYIHSRTIEAFADAVDAQIQVFDRWCAKKEEAIRRALAGLGDPLVVSLLGLEKDVRDRFSGTFNVVLGILRRLVQYICQSRDRLEQAVWNLPNMPTQLPSAVVSALLLDLLLEAVEEQWSMGNIAASDSLATIFAKTSEPIWRMIGRWLKDGMPVRNIWNSLHDNLALDEEFFIEDNELPLMDPDLWADGYVLRGSVDMENGNRKQPAVPVFLGSVVDHVLGAGKAVGLLRMMGIHFETGEEYPLLDSKTFAQVFQSGAVNLRDSESLSQVVSEELSGYCIAAGLRLSRVLTEECELFRHLAAVEGLYLMTRGDVMSNFTDVLFSKMDSQQAWNDFHFVNSAFRDVIGATNSNWIDPSLIRFSYRGVKAATITSTVGAIAGLLVEYAFPFPLTYIFTPKVLQNYRALFVFLLQVRRAKCVLERILLRGVAKNLKQRFELKVFYAMRGKLSWFINALFNFLTMDVIHVQVLKFQSVFRQAKSLDEMIKLHSDHLDTLMCKCFLDPTTSSLLKAIQSILDMSIRFRTFFTTFAGDTTHDISRRLSISMSMRRHRSRRQRRLQRDVIGFSVPSGRSEGESDTGSESDAESDLDGADRVPSPLPTLGLGGEETDPSFLGAPDEAFGMQLERWSSELDGLVRYVRRAAESLARGGGEAEAFRVFVFTLEDWDS